MTDCTASSAKWRPIPNRGKDKRKMSDFFKNSALGKRLGAKGLYITLGACLIALAGAGAAAYNMAMNEINESLVVEDTLPVRPADNKKTDVPKTDSSSQAETSVTIQTQSSKPDDDSSSKAAEKTASQPNVMPVHGEIINPFSFGELVKDETLGVWKTHDGVDIRSEPGTAVKAMNKGTVIEVKEDPLWGNCVTIDHGNGVTGCYYGLSKAINVTEGEQVNSGDVIGAVGDTAECEVAELSHLHFGVKKNGEWVDPLVYIGARRSK